MRKRKESTRHAMITSPSPMPYTILFWDLCLLCLRRRVIFNDRLSRIKVVHNLPLTLDRLDWNRAPLNALCDLAIIPNNHALYSI